MSSPNSHSLLSPSSSHTWLICTPSAVLESSEPSIQSPYAEEGTEAHSLAELKLSHLLGYISDKEFETRYEIFKKDIFASDLYRSIATKSDTSVINKSNEYTKGLIIIP